MLDCNISVEKKTSKYKILENIIFLFRISLIEFSSASYFVQGTHWMHERIFETDLVYHKSQSMTSVFIGNWMITDMLVTW